MNRVQWREGSPPGLLLIGWGSTAVPSQWQGQLLIARLVVVPLGLLRVSVLTIVFPPLLLFGPHLMTVLGLWKAEREEGEEYGPLSYTSVATWYISEMSCDNNGWHT